jgi:hypothetical protein
MDMDDQCNRDTGGEVPFINTNIILIKSKVMQIFGE